MPSLLMLLGSGDGALATRACGGSDEGKSLPTGVEVAPPAKPASVLQDVCVLGGPVMLRVISPASSAGMTRFGSNGILLLMLCCIIGLSGYLWAAPRGAALMAALLPFD
mmetsp:Transcript_24776/g.45435  ORF Transcript_24776/g.45435 Transcript_24776/m.45435 type:complete len:109 (-) Transcript_24776:39-365(-)